MRILFLCIVAVLLYFPTFRAPFCFDDQLVIINNPLIQDLSLGWRGIVEVWSFQHSRFLTNLSFALNFHCHQLDTFGYHLVNWVIHLLTTLGVWFLARLILQIKKEPKSKTDLAFWAALLFLVHPVCTESVSYISQRSSALVALFYLWSVIAYIQARISDRQQVVYFGLAFLGAGLAILSKETAMTLPLAWVLVDYFIIGRRSPRWIGGICVMMLLTVVFFFDGHWRSTLCSSIYSQSHRNDLLTPYNYLLTQLRVLVVLFNLIVCPLGLNVDYDFAMSHSFFEWPVILSSLFLASLGFVAYRIRKSYWAFSFVIAWFLISLLTHILPVRANVIAEHKLYLTLVLFIPVFCYGIYKNLTPRIFTAVMITLVLVFSGLTLLRNQLWADPVRLWQDCLTHSPYKARPYLNLGVAYFEKQQFNEALQAYQKAIQLAPEVPQPYINASEIYYRQGNSSQALAYIQKAKLLAPTSYLPYLQGGVLLARLNRNSEAVVDLTKALELNPQSRAIYKMRGLLYVRLHQQKDALKDLSVWLLWNTKDELALSQRADIYFDRKEYSLALQDYTVLIHLHPIAGYYYNRSVLYEILGDKEHMSQDRTLAQKAGFKL
ncbi:MAG: tetratricopeptide repeat protein [Candidatus Omnitrophica bacterium]|nr:tetratricopeptide repeat protein [Candidatus Omnitrophota bacterium]